MHKRAGGNSKRNNCQATDCCHLVFAGFTKRFTQSFASKHTIPISTATSIWSVRINQSHIFRWIF